MRKKFDIQAELKLTPLASQTACRKYELWKDCKDLPQRNIHTYPCLPVVCITQPVTNINLFTPSYTQSLCYPYHCIIAQTDNFMQVVTGEREVTKGELHYQTKPSLSQAINTPFLSAFGLDKFVDNGRGKEGQRKDEKEVIAGQLLSA